MSSRSRSISHLMRLKLGRAAVAGDRLAQCEATPFQLIQQRHEVGPTSVI